MKKGGLFIVLPSVVLLSIPSAMAKRTELISKSSSGEIGNSDSYNPSVSGNGQFVVFDSYADNLVEDDDNHHRDVFYRNRNTGITKLVSVSSIGTQGDGDSFHPVISADGSTVAYVSRASDLVAGDSEGIADIFLYDMATKETSRITFGSDGNEADGNSDNPALSSDGRYVVYHSSATNLIPNDTNEQTDVFRYDRQTGKTVRVSVDFQGNELTDGPSTAPVISATGRYVDFQSDASYITPCDDNHHSDVFRRDSHDFVDDVIEGNLPAIVHLVLCQSHHLVVTAFRGQQEAAADVLLGAREVFRGDARLAEASKDAADQCDGRQGEIRVDAGVDAEHARVRV